MAATLSQFVKVGTTYFNMSEIKQVVTCGDGTADLYYGGGQDRVKLHLGANEAAAISALNGILVVADFTSYL